MREDATLLTRVDAARRPKAVLPRLLASSTGYAFAVLLVILWQVFWELKWINTIAIPSPLEVLTGGASLIASGELWADVWASLQRVMVGYCLAVVVGVPTGLVIGRSTVLGRLFLPIIEMLRPIPPLAWIPLSIVWFGIGNGPAYFIVFLTAVFPVFVNSMAGAQATDELYVDAAQCLGAGRWLILTRVVLPAALPNVFTGLRLGAGFAWIAVVAAELVAARSGLGYLIQESGVTLQINLIIVGMVAIGLLGLLTNFVMARLARWAMPWHAGEERFL